MPPVDASTAWVSTLPIEITQSKRKIEVLAPKNAKAILGKRCLISTSSKPKVEADIN